MTKATIKPTNPHTSGIVGETPGIKIISDGDAGSISVGFIIVPMNARTKKINTKALMNRQVHRPISPKILHAFRGLEILSKIF
jgi:hypothetical protein